ncbi:MAG: ribonuclease [Candidatus Atribacteria bacterium]|nr:ribonuclease [Candidatus Atribacteria bacterium]
MLLEESLWSKGYTLVGGVDEAGRGSLAGPIVASCVVLPAYSSLPGLKDSKLLSRKQREVLFEQVCSLATSVGIGLIGEGIIDMVGINRANYLAFWEAIRGVEMMSSVDFLILDWINLPGLLIPSISTTHAESKSLTVAAASVVAKVTRDQLMTDFYHSEFPHYGFAQHKGYGTKQHLAALEVWGMSPVHRRTFCRRYEEKRKGKPGRSSRLPLD